jgi:hypothetical protein
LGLVQPIQYPNDVFLASVNHVVPTPIHVPSYIGKHPAYYGVDPGLDVLPGEGFHHQNVQIQTFDEHPEEVGQVEVVQQDYEEDAEGFVGLQGRLKAVHEDPHEVRQDVGAHQIHVDGVAEAAQILELPEDVDGEQEGHQADGVADEVDCGGQFHLGTF